MKIGREVVINCKIVIANSKKITIPDKTTKEILYNHEYGRKYLYNYLHSQEIN